MSRAEAVVGDLSGLPDHSFGSTGLGWWGAVGFMLIAGTGFVLAIGAYFYLRPGGSAWLAGQPSLLWGTLFTAVAIASEIPNAWIRRRAKRYDQPAVRLGLMLMTLLGVALLGLRAMEFAALDVRWDRNAFGSIVWALLALHTLHMAAGILGTGMLAAIARSRTFGGRRFSDVVDNALFWSFVVWSWPVLYAVVYWTPRWL